MVEKIAMNFRASKSNVSGFADVPLTSRLRSADVDADNDADVGLRRSATSPLFWMGGYVYIPLGKSPLRMRLERLL
ncbi:hypothetical protein SE15_03115 [Thermanaerothrix daxensis]|uniref:Uncharacterized protein n=1 Tax=Thermanaerothrix daxensis TaxID=869279 RepID=A0A0P6Y419_9CHLR|nr:hypothetical protein SE15_03115 [Thermanaerothrix daxensis]